MLQEQFLKIMSLVFQKEVTESDNLSMESDSEWTSLRHIELIVTMEEEFDISFDAEDIPQLTSQEKLFRKVSELVNGN